MSGEQERFTAAIDRMTEIFTEVCTALQSIAPGASTAIWEKIFSLAGRDARKLFGDVLLQRDVHKAIPVTRCRHCGQPIFAVLRLPDSWENGQHQMVCPARQPGIGPHEPEGA